MKFDKEFIRRRWLETRIGYGNYLVFIFGFSNFLLLLYNFIPIIKDKINLEFFVIIMFFTITPLSIWLGHMHNKLQIPVENKVSMQLNPYKDAIIPNSKDSMNNEFSIFSLSQSSWSLNQSMWNLNYIIYQAKLSQKNMQVNNFILKQFNAPESLYYKEEITDLEKYKNEALQWAEQSKTWKDHIDKWRFAYTLLKDGKKTTEIMKEL